MLGLASCQYSLDPASREESTALLQLIGTPVSSEDVSTPDASLSDPSLLSLEERIHGPFPAAEAALPFQSAVDYSFSSSSQDPSPQDYALGPLSLTAQPSSPFSSSALQLQLFSLPPISFPSLYTAESGNEYSSFPGSSPWNSDDSWFVGHSRSEREEPAVPLGKVGRLVKKVFLEDGNNDVARVYRGAMKGLAQLSDGPTQLLFGEQAHSSIDLRLGTQKAGMYWDIKLTERLDVIIGYEQAAFSDAQGDSALLLYLKKRF